MPNISWCWNIRFKIVGVFTQGDLEDDFWGKSAESYNTQCFVSEKVFGEVVCPAYNRSGDGADTRLIREARALYDYSKLKPEEVPAFYEISGELEQENVKINGREVLRQYFEDKEKAERTIAILQVPTMVLLALFIFMVAAKMLDMEQNEISVLKRGIGRADRISLLLPVSLHYPCLPSSGASLSFSYGSRRRICQFLYGICKQGKPALKDNGKSMGTAYLVGVLLYSGYDNSGYSQMPGYHCGTEKKERQA